MGRHSPSGDNRMQLVQRVAQLEAELAQARTELAAFDAADHSKPAHATGPELEHEREAVTHSSSVDSKLDLFMSRFSGRDDVYARRWESTKTGKRGWSPATRSGFYDPKRARPEDYEPLSRQLVARHLSGARNAAPDDTRKPLHIGLYPLRKDDTCRLLACDFDEADWQSAARAFVSECTDAGVDSLAEISSSGAGAHIWMFFESSVPAAVARRAGLTLLRRAIDKDRSISFSSYDRLFPSQDRLPINSSGRGSFGNLIALPLQGDMRSKGTTVFADPHTWMPYEDQFSALDRTRPVPVAIIDSLADDPGADRLGPRDSTGTTAGRGDNSRWRPKPRQGEIKALRSEISGAEITVRRDTQLHIPTVGMPSVLVSELKHLSSLANPEFYRKQAMRMSTFGEPRVVVRFEEDEEELRMPRGLADEARSRLELAGYTVRRRSSRRKREPIEADFAGELRKDQRAAVAEMVKYNMGVLVAPPGTEKTVMACAVIAERQVATAILVPTRELLLQWRERLSQFLSLDDNQIGQLGGGKRKTTGIIDLIMMRSISHRNADPSALNRYGQIIIDECHGAAAPAAEAALNRVDAPRWLGLTATPYRADQLNGLITMQCGPIRWDMSVPSSDNASSPSGTDARAEDSENDPPERRLVIHPTQFATEESGSSGPSMPDLYGELSEDQSRNELIVNEIAKSANLNRHILVLTNRIDHLRRLAQELKGRVPDEFPLIELHGQLKPDERVVQRENLQSAALSGRPFILLAIDKVAGEGFDLPSLDTLFLTMPIAFKGKIVQNLGRVTRGGSAAEVTVHDFYDSLVPVLDRMFLKRQRAIKKEGFAPTR